MVQIYLAIVSNATVVDAAYVMKSLGVKYALNLDGGEVQHFI